MTVRTEFEKANNISFGVYIRKNLVNAFRDACKANNRTIASVVRELFTSYIEETEANTSANSNDNGE